MPAVTAAAVTAVVGAEEAPTWLQGALGELRATLSAQHVSAAGTAGGIFSDEVYAQHRGR